MHMTTTNQPLVTPSSVFSPRKNILCPALPGQLCISPQVATCTGVKAIELALDGPAPHVHLSYSSCMYSSPAEVYLPHRDIFLTNSEVNITMVTKEHMSLEVEAFLNFHQSSDSAFPSEPYPRATMDNGRRRSRSFTSTSSVYYDQFDSPSNLQAFSVSSSTTSPDSLIDDDPFADLSVAPVASRSRANSSILPPILSIASPSVPTTPKSPLSPTHTDFPSDSTAVLAPSVGLRTFSYTQPLHARPAYQKRAFAPRPSLPSLSTLAKMNVGIPNKVRKGRVGAHLPSEPWDTPSFGVPASPAQSSDSKVQQERMIGPALSASFASDFVSDLDGDFLDLSSPEDEYYDEPIPFSTSPEEARPSELLHASSSHASTSAYSEEELLLSGVPIRLPSEEEVSLAALSRSMSPELSDQRTSPNPRSRSFSTSSSESDGEEYATWDWLDRLRETSPTINSTRNKLLRTQQSDSSIGRESFSSERSSSSSLNSPHDEYSPSFTSDSSSDDYSSYEQHLLPEPSSTGYPQSATFQNIPVDSSISDSSSLNSQFYFGIGPHEHESDDSKVFSELLKASRKRGPTPITPHTSLSDATFNVNLLCVAEEDDSIFQPGTSAGTIRAMPVPGRHSNTRGLSATPQGQSAIMAVPRGRTAKHFETEMVDGAEDYGQRGRSHGTGNGASSGNGMGHDNGGGGYGNYGGDYGSSWAGSGGDGGDDGDHNRRNNGYRNVYPLSDSSELDEEEEEESSSDEYGEPSARPPVANAQGADSDDDNVPLAKKIPTALRAQQSIRMKDREARERRRQERQAREQARNRQAAVKSPPGAASPPPRPSMISSTQEAALHAMKSVRRPRAQTAHDSVPPPFPIDDLTKKLEDIQVNGKASSSNPSSIPRSRSSGEHGPMVTSPQSMESAVPSRRILRPMRSFHADTRRTEERSMVPLPADAESKIAHNTARARALSVTHNDQRHLSMKSRAVSAPFEQSPPRPQKLERKRTVKSPEAKSTRTSLEHSRPLMPVSAPAEILSRQNKHTLVQQRVFIGDRQRFVVVEISSLTSAGEVLKMVEAQGALKEWRGSGGWMVFEIAQDFGMERPIRNFELLSDIEASWNKDKLVNVFLIKLTPLAPLLSISALPTASPTHFGYVEWESKRGKWNKRYMVLREHCLWLSKREGGKDEVMLCSLSNFDVYQVTRHIKAPKDYTFAIKSTDNLTFFENTADYLHLFSCKTDAGEKWMEKILLARSYVLHQERNVLFQPKSSGAVATNTSGASSSLTRSGTRKGARVQPLVNVAPDSLFEPGSLLRN